MWWHYLLVVVVSYLIGAIPTGVLAGKLTRGVDVRRYGSGKMGFTNALRVLGWRPSLPVLVADVLKGYIPVIGIWVIFHSQALQVAGALAAVVGHIWPIYAGFRGGRGVSTAFGAFMAMSLPLSIVLVPLGVAIVLIFRYMSLMSIIVITVGAVGLTLLALVGFAPYVYVLYSTAVTAIILFQHRGNIRRLLSGTEPKLGQGGDQRYG